MFGLFGRALGRRERSLLAAASDVDTAMLRTFGLLSEAGDDPELLTRRFKAVAALASLIGGLRDAHPGLPIEDRSLAMALIEANGTKQYHDADALLGAVMDLVSAVPNEDRAKINTVLYMLAPS